MFCNRWIHGTVLMLAALGAPAYADVLKIENQDPVVVQQGERPTRGMSQERVIENFGEPNQMHGAVGDPPISRWDYGDFAVYFEGNLVLHSVDYRKEPAPEAPAAPAASE